MKTDIAAFRLCYSSLEFTPREWPDKVMSRFVASTINRSFLLIVTLRPLPLYCFPYPRSIAAGSFFYFPAQNPCCLPCCVCAHRSHLSRTWAAAFLSPLPSFSRAWLNGIAYSLSTEDLLMLRGSPRLHILNHMVRKSKSQIHR